MKPEIEFKDEDLLIVNKPSGWITNEAATTKNQPVLQTWLRKKLDYPIAKDSKYRSGIVHRLDKETSGVLVVAKTKEAFRSLQKQFKERQVKKQYQALVHGRLEPKKGEVRVPVGRLPWRRERFGVVPGGREAVTFYCVVSYFKSPVSDETLSLVDLWPKTGRTHQIRVHMKHLGHSIVSDEFYTGRKVSRADRQWCPRLFLHASRIEFHFYSGDETLSFKAPMPKELEKVLKKLGGGQSTGFTG